MIDKLIAKYKLKNDSCYLIGDSDSDIDAARQAGVRGVKIPANQNMYPFISFLVR